jgi:hypothetical protein
MENVSTEVVKKTGNWFTRLSGGGKAAVVVGAAGVLTGITMLIIHLTKKKDGKTVGGSSGSINNTNANDTTSDKSDEVAKESGSGSVAASSTPSTSSSTTPSSSSSASNALPQQSNLPNGGKGCGQVKDKYDRDFNYVKCGNDWYTISKANPATPANKGKIPNWVSLAGNKAATSRLNARYPNS